MTSLAWVFVTLIALVVIGVAIGMPDIVIVLALSFLVMIALGGSSASSVASGGARRLVKDITCPTCGVTAQVPNEARAYRCGNCWALVEGLDTGRPRARIQ